MYNKEELQRYIEAHFRPVFTHKAEAVSYAPKAGASAPEAAPAALDLLYEEEAFSQELPESAAAEYESESAAFFSPDEAEEAQTGGEAFAALDFCGEEERKAEKCPAPKNAQESSPWYGSVSHAKLRPSRFLNRKQDFPAHKFETDESFRDALFRLMDAKGLTEPELYKKALLDRKLFNKIKNDADYRVGKKTAISLAVALELPLADARSLVERAGFSLSNSILADVIVMYFLEQGEYDLTEINDALIGEDQQPLTNYS